MSKKPKKNNALWILVLVLIFAPGLLTGVVGVVSALIPFAAVIAVLFALGLLFGKKAGKKSAAKAETAEQVQTAENAASAEQARNTDKQKKEPRLKKSAKPGFLKALAVICYILAGLIGFSAVLNLADTGFTAPTDFFTSMVAAAYFLAGGGISHIASNVYRRRERDAFRYAMLIGESETYSLPQLAATISYSLSRVCRDLQRMIDDGVFGDQAYIDMASHRFMRHAAAAQTSDEYSRNMSGAASEPARAAAGEPQQTPQPEEETDMTGFGAILKKIRRLDEEIQDEAVSERIRRIEAITRNIFDYVKDKPEKMPQIRMFMNYYLPTTLKLLESYSRIERVGVAGQNMREAKDNIEKILDMLAAGFEQQLDQLFREENLDITSDIEVLEQMMKKDGLRENDDFVIRTEDFTDGYCDEITDDLSEEEGGAAAMRKPE